MFAFKFHCIKITERTIYHTGRAYDTYKEAAAVAEVMVERETDEEADIRIVDDLELRALTIGMRYTGDPIE